LLSYCEEFYDGQWSNSCIQRFKIKFANNEAEKLIVFLNVGRHYYNSLRLFKTFIGQGVNETGEELRACHYAVAIIDLKRQSVTCCDSNGWGMPDNLHTKALDLLEQLGFSSSFDFFQCHVDTNSLDHVCIKGKCFENILFKPVAMVVV